MLRVLLAASTLFLTLLAACGDDSNDNNLPTAPLNSTNVPTASVRVSPEARPTSIPESATPVLETETLGDITRQANETPHTEDLRELQSAVCANDLLTIQTSVETVYAALTCDKFDNDQFAAFFAGKQVALVLEVSPDRYRILIEALDGTTAELTPDSIWVE